ncbi:MAG: flagellar biosynthesis anti-sigma factor FlgM [Bryobacterales bacterium]|jgi:anti-sigma28 factor (negative regulator of flagellin synthesis)|nr:flagellar biosynthesis anti-sigma factor FlgM [Bryobacterales bacterium]
MNIPDFRPEALRVAETQVTRPEKAPVKREDARRENVPDRVNLTPLSETIIDRLDSTKKVEALKAAYESGAYRVEAESLAKSLVRAHINVPEAKGKP